MSKQLSRKAAAVVAADPPTPPSTHLVFGLNFNLHGTMVPVSTDDIANAKTNGIEFTLPAPVDLGTLDDFAAWFKTQFNIDLPGADQLPAPLDSIMSKLTTLDVAVDQFHIKVPGTASPDQSTLYTLAMSAVWPDGQGIPLIPGVLSIEGAVFGASNETPKSNS
ncbi:hypothetical protein [Xanthomonas hortorum]|uniref:Uncharacterized protein n=1 Tax=Xanthomonas hortorum pv. pelargonii TaxID=453602 RepID=A0A6V7D1J0_9XANT|nr:hypothetical protein [Xanthomonas hortorum]MCE4353705.1 hypothetical protein [Xanthomonas hortorum pv. pelargonii]MCM5525078.1 hypothetical protein [Xanthomonas hortorum pv. pelargonii]MCM5537612.1 hypothetical protein [Xanthomonas hortorum pv. pelargonii]MCM5541767.1 hypothetical protein [Xanthomonas hortorum pv. pelargonii]MCM5545138.1 hypothetical protein [Xanthomonas hortorum pv. pelargonii]